ncbi:MAG TPA: ABC transporter permease [Terriglobales bacterium]|nr:ABC transporter permease [Terriglobales bacterium]
MAQAFSRRESHARPSPFYALTRYMLEAALFVGALWQLSALWQRPVAGMASYFAYAAPALVLVLATAGAAAATAFAVARARSTGDLEAYVVTPAPTAGIVLGLGAYPAAGMLLRAVFAYCWMALAGVVPMGWEILATVLSVALGFAMVPPLGLLCAAAAVAGRRVLAAAMMLLGAAVVLSGALFPLATLPEGLRDASLLSPFRFLVDAVRLCYSGAPPASLLEVWTNLLLWQAVLLPLGWFALEAAFTSARRQGRLRQA